MGLLEKITAKTNDNVFYREYCECCGSCEFANICPIKANYDMLSDSSIQNGITNVLIETIVKNKSLISTRSLMNFFYEIMVDESVFDSGSLSPKKQPQKIGTLEYFNALLPNMLFGRTNVSEVLRTVSLGDPMKIRNEEVDSFFIEYENTPDVLSIFNKDLGKYSFVLEKLSGKNMSESSMYMTKESLLRLFIRLCWLTDKRSDLLPKDEDYLEYMSAVYAWNKGDAHSLKNVYTCVIKGVSAWNGQAEKGKMQLNIGNNQSNYHAIQDIEIKPNYSCLPHSSSDILVSFRDELVLKFDSGKGITASLDMDFDEEDYQRIRTEF